MARAKTAKDSEVHAYGFIKEELKERGWDIRNPSKHPTGQVWAQNECLSDPHIQLCLGQQRPENVIKVSEKCLWVIEAKPYHAQLTQALNEAVDYAMAINRGDFYKALFVSGVAGNPDDTYLVQTRFFYGGKFLPITMNGKEISSLVSPDDTKAVLNQGPVIEDVPIDETLFLTKAERINEYLHAGAINKSSRAKVMAALLLALIDETPPNIDAPPSVLISDINTRARNILATHNKGNFYSFIEIQSPAASENHFKFKRALVRTIQELNSLNIRSAMSSGNDVLGKFYEVFLKYGNGAKEIGIVLTPRHITQFAVDVVGVAYHDVVYDPTCGTAGFLVAAFDAVRRNFGEAQVNRFKNYNLFGVEQDEEVVSLAIVNMIFRGDGKSNIIDGDCFTKNIVRSNGGARYLRKDDQPGELAVTRVLMNPPFPTKKGDDKEHKFVDHALKQMTDGGILFAILPYPAMVKPGGYQQWRKLLLKDHTLLCVMTFPPDLFSPSANTHTVGIFIKKGVPQPKNQKVLWIRAIHDGLVKSKGKRLPHPKEPNDFMTVRDLVKAYLANPSISVESIEQFQKAAPIDFSDDLLELVPENYLDQGPPTNEELRRGIEQIVRDSVAFLIRHGLE